jgi:hypothetical protein
MIATADLEKTYGIALGPQLQGKIPYGDAYWPTFNASFCNVSLSQPDIAAAIYEGQPITTQHKNHWRHSSNYILGQHLGIDFDTEDRRSSLPVLKSDPFVGRYGTLIYTTPSHTPDKPRARVLFLLDNPIMQPANYVLAASALLWIFGSADRQCKDAARFFYGGKPGACEMEWPGNELPLAVLKDLIRRYQETGLQARRQLRAAYQPGTASEREVVEALKHLDPWGMEYDHWLNVLMAIHSEFPGPNGEAIADAWAQAKENEIASKWRSFKREGSTGGRVGIGTLFKMAMERGWTRS